MKKNSMMRLASFLMIAVLLSTSVVGSTFAKYVTAETGSDTARVAKFGVEITANGEMFSDKYVNVDGGNIAGDANLTVEAAEKAVAPGTTGDLVAMTIAGTPEVSVEVKYEATLTLEGWEADLTDDDVVETAYYCPLEITVGSQTFKGLDYANEADPVAAFKADVEEAINAYTDEYAPNQPMANVGAPVVSWVWEFEGNNDYADTYLGDQAAEGNAATITLEITTTVTQLD